MSQPIASCSTNASTAGCKHFSWLVDIRRTTTLSGWCRGWPPYRVRRRWTSRRFVLWFRRLLRAKYRVMLTVLKREGLIVERRARRFQLRARVFTTSLEPLACAYEERRQRDQGKLEQMVVYAQTALCRTRFLLDALGEPPGWEQCGTCDNCRGTTIRAAAVAQGAA